MLSKPAHGLFITGSDTNVGKTYVAAIIARELVAARVRVGVYKPVASGCRVESNSLVADDAVALWEAAGRPGDLEQVCPQRFAAPLAPHLAARAEGKTVHAKLLRSGYDLWREQYDFVIVEGAGGLMSPITDDEYVADLAYDFGLPLVVVVKNSLGAINQGLQTLIVAETFRGGLAIAGIVLNQPDLPPHDASILTNRTELSARSIPPVLAEISHGERNTNVKWLNLVQAK